MRIFQLFLFCGLFFCGGINAQGPSTGDCEGAIPLTGFYDMPVFTIPINYVPNEINPDSSCLAGGEVNGYWFKWMILDSGILSFNIIPYTHTDDYDFALFNLTSSICADLFNIDSLEVRCNYSNSISNNGILGANGGPNNQDEPTLLVLPGQIFKLFVSNYSGSQSGFQIDMSASTCGFDPAIGIPKNDLAHQVKIGPNPTVGSFNVVLDQLLLAELDKIQVMNMHGEMMICQTENFEPAIKFDLSGRPAGIYFVQICTQNQPYNFKLILQ